MFGAQAEGSKLVAILEGTSFSSLAAYSADMCLPNRTRMTLCVHQKYVGVRWLFSRHVPANSSHSRACIRGRSYRSGCCREIMRCRIALQQNSAFKRGLCSFAQGAGAVVVVVSESIVEFVETAIVSCAVPIPVRRMCRQRGHEWWWLCAEESS